MLFLTFINHELSFSSFICFFMVVQINYRYWSFFKGLLFTFQCALCSLFSQLGTFYIVPSLFLFVNTFLIFFKYFFVLFFIVSRQNNKLVNLLVFLIFMLLFTNFLYLIWHFKYITTCFNYCQHFF